MEPREPVSAAGGSQAYSGAPISLNLQNVEIRGLLQVLAEHSGFNIVVSDSIGGTLSLRMRDVPWDQVLDTILQARGLAARRDGAVIWVASKADLAARERLELEGQQALQAIAAVRTHSFRLNYARADELARQLQAGVGAGRLLSPRGSVMAEVRTNQLFVTDVASRIEMIEALVRQLDIPVRQVMIEARIVEAADTFGRSLGIRLGGRLASSAARPDKHALTGGQLGGGYLAPQVPATGEPLAGRDFGIAGRDFVNLPAAGLNGVPAANLAVALFNASVTRVLNLELSALEADGQGQIVASPRIVTADQVKAIIEQGTELPYQLATSSGATAVAFRKANLKLEVTPHITPEGAILLNVDVNKDSVGRSTPNGFAIDTKHVQTQVLVDNGGTVMIGGIYETLEREEEYRVPVLGSLPVLGALFRSRTKSLSKTELLVFISPELLAPTQAPR
jgi:type IV pilus assembly protein PilQ